MIITTLEELQALLKPCLPEESTLRILGQPYIAPDAALTAFMALLEGVEEFAEEWADLKKALSADLQAWRGPQADARLLALFSFYLITVRSTAESGEFLPGNMMTWLGKAPNRIPSENAIWFLQETEDVGSEGARDVIHVLGAETIFLGHFLSDRGDDDVLEQAGIYLAKLLHLREKWPAHYTWMGIESRMQQIRSLFLLGSDELPILQKRGGKEFMDKAFQEVYLLLSKTMHQTSFFVLLRDYAEALKVSRGVLSPEIKAIQDALLAD